MIKFAHQQCEPSGKNLMPAQEQTECKEAKIRFPTMIPDIQGSWKHQFLTITAEAPLWLMEDCPNLASHKRENTSFKSTKKITWHYRKYSSILKQILKCTSSCNTFFLLLFCKAKQISVRVSITNLLPESFTSLFKSNIASLQKCYKVKHVGHSIESKFLTCIVSHHTRFCFCICNVNF